MHLLVNLNELPADGKILSGEIRPDIFGLSGPGAPKMMGPVRYDLRVYLDRDLVIVEGELEALFEIECSRCLEPFLYQVVLDPYSSEDPREGRTTLDLTELIREDILLALPGYPHCEESNVDERECPAADRFAASSHFSPLPEEEGDAERSKDIWKALDKLKPGTDDN